MAKNTVNLDATVFFSLYLPLGGKIMQFLGEVIHTTHKALMRSQNLDALALSRDILIAARALAQ